MKDKVVHLSDKWSLSQLIEIQDRRTRARNEEAFERHRLLNQRFEELLAREKVGKDNVNEKLGEE